jgi:hypothetical protein
MDQLPLFENQKEKPCPPTLPRELFSMIPVGWRNSAISVSQRIYADQGAQGLKKAIDFTNEAMGAGVNFTSGYGAYMKATCFERHYHLAD